MLIFPPGKLARHERSWLAFTEMKEEFSWSCFVLCFVCFSTNPDQSQNQMTVSAPRFLPALTQNDRRAGLDFGTF